MKSPGPFRVGLNFRVDLTQIPSVAIMSLVSHPIHSTFIVSCHLQSIVDSTSCQDVYPSTPGAIYSFLHIEREGERERLEGVGQIDRQAETDRGRQAERQA